MRKLILLLCVFAAFNDSYAQNEQQQINAIKSNMDFLYATGISSVSGEEASDNAKDLLALEIEQWLKGKNTDDIAGYVAKSKETASQINTRRGSLYRVFVYVKKKDVLPYYNGENVMQVDFVPAQTPQNDTDADNDDTVLNPTTTTLKEEVEVKVEADTDSSTPLATRQEESDRYLPTEEEKAMANIASFTELNDYINRCRRDGSIVNVGKYSDMPKTGIIYVFIHNRLGEIPACMKVTNGTAVNLSTGKDDTISDYKGCGAIWIKINND